MDKSPDAFRTISEVAADLGLPQHVLRFWETKFPHIKPLKRGGGRRYYRPDDVELLRGIRHLLYGEGYTIRGVQRILKEQGVRFVMNVWREGAPQPKGQGAARGRPAEPTVRQRPAYDQEAGGPADGGYDDDAGRDGYDDATGQDGYDDAAGQVGYDEDIGRDGYGGGGHGPEPDAYGDFGAEPPQASSRPSAAAMAQRFAPRGPAGEADRMLGRPRDMGPTPVARPLAAHAEPAEPVGPTRTARPVGGPDEGEGRSAFGSIMDRFRGAPPRDAEPAGPEANPRLTGDQVRRLQTTLFELLECKRLLDQVR